MARIIVKADDDGHELLDEFALPDHLLDDAAAKQLLDRLEWAVREAHGMPWGGDPGGPHPYPARRPARRPSGERLHAVRTDYISVPGD